MNGLGDHDHRRPAAEAVRLLDRRRRRSSTRSRRSSTTSTRPTRRRSLVGLGVLVVLLVLPRVTTPDARRSSSRSSARPSSRRSSASPTTASRRSASLPQGVPDAEPSRGRSVERRRAAAGRRARHHPRLADRHDRDRDQLRRPARRRGRARPGDDRHRRGEHRGRASSRASPSRRAARAPPSPSSRARKSQVTGLVGAGLVAVLLLFLNSLLADLPQTALAAVVIAAALSLMDLARAAPLLRGAPERAACSRSSRPPASCCSACCRASSSRSCWRSCCSSGATGGRTARCSAASTSVEGWHSVDGLPRRRAAARASSSTAGRRRCSSPTRASFRQQIRRLVREREPALDRPAVRGDHRRRRHRGRDARAARRRAQRGRASTSPSSSCATGSRSSTLRYGLFETLDRDHFYPTLEAALRELQAPEP